MSVDPEQGTPNPGNSPTPTEFAAWRLTHPPMAGAEEPEPVVTEPVTPPEPVVDWEKRFTDTQAAYTQSQQELASLRKLADGEDPEALKAVLDKYGYSIEDEPETEPVVTPATDPRIDEIVQWKAQQEEREQQATKKAEWDGWTDYVKTEAKTAGVDLTDREVKAFQLDSVGDNGLPVPPEKAKQILTDYLAERETWLESLRKPRPRAPHVPAGGHAATGGKAPEDMNRQEFDAYVVERLQAEAS